MKVAVYAGSFDPLTVGHIDIINRSRSLFDKLIVLVSENRGKNYAFTVPERMAMLKECTKGYKNVEVAHTDGLVVGYVHSVEACAIIRGIRKADDLEYERTQEFCNRHIAESRKSTIETIYLLSNEKNVFISSSLVKSCYKIGVDISGFVPKDILRMVCERLKVINR